MNRSTKFSPSTSSQDTKKKERKENHKRKTQMFQNCEEARTPRAAYCGVNGSRRTGTPWRGRSVSTLTGAWRYSSEMPKRKLASITASTTLASTMAYAWPTQLRGPDANGRNRPAHGRGLPGANRSGLNSCASAPHTASSWWMASTGIHSDAPLGTRSSSPGPEPSVMSSNAIRGSSVAGGYSRSVSLITICSCGQAGRHG